MTKALTKNPLGPLGKAVADNVARLLKEQNLTFAALAKRLEEIGRPIPPLGLRKIVAQTRRVDVDDLIGLAIALGTTPPSLMMPQLRAVRRDDQVALTDGSNELSGAEAVWDWLTGQKELVKHSFAGFIDRSWPSWVRERWEEDQQQWQDAAYNQVVRQLTRDRDRGDD